MNVSGESLVSPKCKKHPILLSLCISAQSAAVEALCIFSRHHNTCPNAFLTRKARKSGICGLPFFPSFHVEKQELRRRNFEQVILLDHAGAKPSRFYRKDEA